MIFDSIKTFTGKCCLSRDTFLSISSALLAKFATSLYYSTFLCLFTGLIVSPVCVCVGYWWWCWCSADQCDAVLCCVYDTQRDRAEHSTAEQSSREQRSHRWACSAVMMMRSIITHTRTRTHIPACTSLCRKSVWRTSTQNSLFWNRARTHVHPVRKNWNARPRSGQTFQLIV